MIFSIRSPFPAMHVKHCNESVATDTIYSNTVAIYNRSKTVQLFAGIPSLFSNIYGMNSYKQFKSTSGYIIHEKGTIS